MCNGLACAPDSDATGLGGDTLQRIQSERRVRIGFANEAPFAYVESASGDLTGEAPEVLKTVMARLGVSEIEGVLTEFGSLIPGLKAGRFDVIAAGMYITPERCEQIAFSDPTYAIGEAFVVKKDNPLALHSYEDVAKHPSARLAVVAGAVERSYALACGVPQSRLVVFPDAPSAIAGVLSDRVDAYAGTSLTVRDLLEKSNNDALEQADPFTDPVIEGQSVRGYGAFGFRLADSALRDAVNSELASFLGSDEHLAMVQPFGFTQNELPGGMTANALCGARTQPEAR
ncbi:MAG: ectoine/hydroxyectoine ABC transporter substrate-binding protein EhuB [Candidatus Hydrogenedentota bacterium]